MEESVSDLSDLVVVPFTSSGSGLLPIFEDDKLVKGATTLR